MVLGGPERVIQFANACEADARGRKGLEDRSYPNAAMFKHCAAAAKATDTKAAIDKGYEGVKLGEEIRRLRIEAIGSAVKSFKASLAE